MPPSQTQSSSFIDLTDVTGLDPDLLSQVREVPANQAPFEERTRSAVLEDSLGRLQIIIPDQALLDIDYINAEFGQTLRAISPDARSLLCERLGWTTLPVLPHLHNTRLVADPAIATGGMVCLPLPENESFLRIPSALLSAILERDRVTWLRCSVALAEVRVNHEQPDRDLAQIDRSIANLTSRRIKKRLQETLEVPPLPETARRVIRLRSDPNADIPKLVEVVETDPALAAQIVSWAGSSFYAAPGKISSVHDAVMRVLGFDLVMNLAMGLSLGQTLRLPDDAPQGLTDYWEDAVWTASAASSLTDLIPSEKRPQPGLAYLSGLLHNFGTLLLWHVFPPHYQQVCRSIEANPELDPENCEHFVLGVTREQMGACLLEAWGLPEEVVCGLRFQKHPYYAGAQSHYSRLLFLTTQLLREQGIGDGPVQPIPAAIWTDLGLDENEARQLVDNLMGMAAELRMMITELRGSG